MASCFAARFLLKSDDDLPSLPSDLPVARCLQSQISKVGNFERSHFARLQGPRLDSLKIRRFEEIVFLTKRILLTIDCSQRIFCGSFFAPNVSHVSKMPFLHVPCPSRISVC